MPDGMGLRDRLRARVESTLARFSGEYSAAQDSIRTPSEAPAPADGARPAQGDVQVTRARLRRPREADTSGTSDQG